GFELTAVDRSHWAFQALRPTAGEEGIDGFILADLAAEGLGLSPAASPEALIRRVTLDLIGLPPTPEAVDAFVRDSSTKAYEKLVEDLLASPRYGERWGRHWLDLVRFAETDGFEHDAVRPHAWQYRDYVIRSFNDDKPYDRFVREQLAGDEIWPEQPDALIATGYALLGPDMVDSSDQVQRRHNTLNDITDTTGLVFLGLTMGCARCHDHKFEPISQRDYYQMQAYFSSCSLDRERPVPSVVQRRDYELAMQRYEANEVVQELARIEAPVRERLRLKKLSKLSPEAQKAHAVPEEKRSAEEQNLVLETVAKVKVSSKEVEGAISGELRGRYDALHAAVSRLGAPPKLPVAMALSTGKAQPTFVLRRGEYSMPLDEVVPGTPQVLPSMTAEVSRKALADWIASPSNPLTARVMVNRLWQHHFGDALVRSPNNFGFTGAQPTHPELLDWLAAELQEGNWKLKRLHKLLVMSRTYRQSSLHPQYAEYAEQDFANNYWWRANRRRLDAEAFRDSLVNAAGILDLTETGGESFKPDFPAEALEGLSKKGAAWTP
ncbi:MAG: DUF1549 domain-containing protein, partial [Verrucomicrobiales bacterium]|nr:DUF1549 domain-containing protein [Verrucomicrobiales bacterium]